MRSPMWLNLARFLIQNGCVERTYLGKCHCGSGAQYKFKGHFICSDICLAEILDEYDYAIDIWQKAVNECLK